MSFSQALSGLNAQQQSLGAIGNNIANSQTVGFKSSSVQFADVFANSRIGLGTRVSAVLQNFNEGNVESTNRNLDLAISGTGFYRFEQGGEVVYSRNGQLNLTPEGFLQNAQGARLMGYPYNDATGAVMAGGQPGVLQVNSDELQANATTNVATTFNLDSRYEAGVDLNEATVRTDLADPLVTAPVAYHFSNNFTVYDSLGNPKNITVYYEKIDEDVDGNPVTNTWNARVAMDGFYDSGNDFTIQFNNRGLLQAVTGDNVEGNIPQIGFSEAQLGGDPEALSFGLNIAGSTQFGNNSTTSALTQNGYTSGALVGITIEDDGTIMRNYANEQSRPAGQITLANFRNPEGLRPEGDNAWVATQASGQELLGAPGTGQLGLIVSGAVETSNVDMARELVNMIVSQRAYQANSQTIKTQDELLQTAINLR